MARTADQCNTMVFNAGVKFGVSPRTIWSKLLSLEDYADMLAGDIDFDTLCAHIEVWKSGGMQDLVNYSTSES